MNRLYFLPPFLLQNTVRYACRVFFRVSGNLKVSGLENIPFGTERIIFASNHSSELDPILIPVSIPVFKSPGPMFYASLPKGLYKDLSIWKEFLYGGLFFKAWGAHPVRLGVKNYEFSLEKHRQILEQGGKLCIFPEGGRSKDCTIKKAKGGIGYLAHSTGAVVVPIYIGGVCQKDKDRNKNITMKYGKPIVVDMPNDISDKERLSGYKDFAESVMKEIEKLMLK